MTFQPIQTRRSRTTSVLGRGCAILGVLLGVGGFCLGMTAAGLAIFAPNTLTNVMAGLTGTQLQQTTQINGDASNYDAFAYYALVRDFADPSAQLISIEARFVRSDGTMDLTASYTPSPQVTYKFVRTVPPPTNAPPVGAGGNGGDTWYQPITITAYQPGRRSHISEFSNGVSFSYDFVNDGYTRETSSITSTLGKPIIKQPYCNLVDLWKTAIQTKDAPKDAVATITYDANGYTFDIAGRSISLHFDMQCKVTDS